MIPISLRTIVDGLDVGDWFELDVEDAPEDLSTPGALAIFRVRIGDVQFRIRAPYIDPGPIEVLEAARVAGEPRAKWPNLASLRPEVVRLHRRRRGKTDEPVDDEEDPPPAPPEPGSAA